MYIGSTLPFSLPFLLPYHGSCSVVTTCSCLLPYTLRFWFTHLYHTFILGCCLLTTRHIAACHTNTWFYLPPHTYTHCSSHTHTLPTCLPTLAVLLPHCALPLPACVISHFIPSYIYYRLLPPPHSFLYTYSVTFYLYTAVLIYHTTIYFTIYSITYLHFTHIHLDYYSSIPRFFPHLFTYIQVMPTYCPHYLLLGCAYLFWITRLLCPIPTTHIHYAVGLDYPSWLLDLFLFLHWRVHVVVSFTFLHYSPHTVVVLGSPVPQAPPSWLALFPQLCIVKLLTTLHIVFSSSFVFIHTLLHITHYLHACPGCTGYNIAEHTIYLVPVLH